MAMLKKGSKGPDVRKLQELLNKVLKPSPALPVDGDFGPGTEESLKKFQQKSGLKPDGVAGPETMQGLQGGDGPARGKGKGKVAGDTSGVDRILVEALEAVAEHYGITLEITSGKRSPDEQASSMWKNWKTNLKEGALYTPLASNKTLLEKLRTAYDEKDRGTFDTEVKKIAPKLSLHVSGQAVDLKKSTDAKAVKALAGMFHHIPEATCHHFDTKKAPSKIDDAAKARWPK